jgi:outer membrane protein
MAPIDIVEAQAEVARNQEAVIVAEAAIKQAEDRLRALILDPDTPDFWTVTLEPSDNAPYSVGDLNIETAVQRATANRSEVLQAKNGLQQNDITIQYLRNQVLPEVNASATYGLVGVGGTQLEPLNFSQLGGGIPVRNIVAARGFNSVLGDVFTNAYPAWTFGVQIGYPIGTSTSEANLAKARLQHSQAQTQLRNTELQIATQVRDAGRQVQTNRQRVETSRVSRELAERRLEAEEKKLAAGIQTTFFVFQAQRDLAQARTNEVKALLDYNKSMVDFEAVQEVPLR